MINKRKVILLAVGAAVCAVAAVLALKFTVPKQLDIGTRRQFFWDLNIIDEEKTTASRMLHSPVAQEALFTADKPWESGNIGSFCVVQSAEGCRLYYTAWDAASAARICLAESADGIHWEKPSLGLVDYEGSSENNILLDNASGITALSVFEDTAPAAKEHFKAVGTRSDGSLSAFSSLDGLIWTENGSLGKKMVTATGGPVSLCSAYYDAAQQRYLCYFIRQEKSRQEIAVTSSKNFRRWSTPKSLTFGEVAEAFTLQTANISPYYRSESGLVGFPLRISEPSAEEAAGNLALRKECTDTRITDALFLSSGDGSRFTLPPEAWLTPGPENESNWLFGDCFLAAGMAETPALHSDDGQDYELSLYAAENISGEKATQLRRYTTRIDGFVSFHAPYDTRRVYTKPLVFSGSRMTVNFRTSNSGSLFVRILDKDGNPFELLPYTDESGEEYQVPAYTSYRLFGDRVDREVAFNGDLSALVGQTVVLEFTMSDCELYSFRFDDEPYENTTEWQPTEIPVQEYGSFTCESAEGVPEIGSDRQLFWDDYIVDTEMTTASAVSHSPVRREKLFETNLPWEGDNCDFYVIVADEDELGAAFYRMYYLGWDSAYPSDIRVCYAQSYDGKSWEKPNLGLHSYTDPATGTVYSDTNIMLYTEEAPFDNFFVMKDPRENVPESRRYIALAEGGVDTQGYSSFGLWGWVSADGIHWTKTHRVLPQKDEWFAAFDSVNTMVWQEESQKLFTYFRVRENTEQNGVEFPDFRKIYGAVSDEFEPVDEETIFPLDYGENSPLFEMYTNNIAPYYRAPQLYLGFPTRFTRRIAWEKNYEYLTDPQARREKYEAGQVTRTLSMTEALYMTSRDGYHWNRQNEAWLTPGPEYSANWIYGNCYPAYGLVETAAEHPGQDGELSTYLFEGKFYHEPSVLYRYAMRIDGLRSYRGSYETQSLTTKPFTFRGKELLVNFRTSAAGSVQVQLLDESGSPIPGYTSSKLVGDRVDRAISFENSLEALSGKTVRLQFLLSDAEVYSFKFTENGIAR